MDSLVFAQGQTATLTAQFVTNVGMPVDVPDAMIQILGPSAVPVLIPTAMNRAFTGFYFYDYVIPNSLPVNTYTVVITGTVIGVPSAMSIFLQIVPAGTVTAATATQHATAVAAAMDRYIGCAQRIPIYRELAQRDATKTRYHLTWPRWNLSNHRIYLNGEEITDGFTIDLDNAIITFAKPLHPTDIIEASYNFRFFSDMDILGFLSDAISQINIQPPQSTFTVDNFPDAFIGVALLGASKNAMKQLIFCLSLQEPATIFGGIDGAKNAIDNFKYLKDNNEKEFADAAQTLKTKQPYPKISAIVQPEYTLPGGRSRWFRYLFSTNIG